MTAKLWLICVGCSIGLYRCREDGQDGYGAFSVDPADIDKVVYYISRQRVYHQSTSFGTEYRGRLKKYQVNYKEKYVWD